MILLKKIMYIDLNKPPDKIILAVRSRYTEKRLKTVFLDQQILYYDNLLRDNVTNQSVIN